MQQPSLNSRVEIRSRTELRCPAYKVNGPVPIPLPLHDPQPSQEQQLLLDSWYVVQGQFPPPTLEVSAIREALRLATLDTTLPVFEILYVARSWRLQLQRCNQWDEDDGFAVALNRYINDFSIQWLFADATVPDKPIEDPVTVLDHWTLHGSGVVMVPRPISYRQIMIAHLFSGRRRSGDFQEWASLTSFQDGKFTTLPLSVDIIFSERWGNLLNPATAALFYDAIRSGLLVAVLAGPPCETWSIARQRGLYLDDGPRPLRSLEQLAGFSLLTIREVRQLCLGNELLALPFRLQCCCGYVVVFACLSIRASLFIPRLPRYGGRWLVFSSFANPATESSRSTRATSERKVRNLQSSLSRIVQLMRNAFSNAIGRLRAYQRRFQLAKMPRDATTLPP